MWKKRESVKLLKVQIPNMSDQEPPEDQNNEVEAETDFIDSPPKPVHNEPQMRDKTAMSGTPQPREDKPPKFHKEFLRSVKDRNRERVSKLLQDNPELSTYTDNLGISGLKQCVESRSVELMTIFINNEKSNIKRAELINYAVLYAIQSDDVTMVKYLLDRKEELEAAFGLSSPFPRKPHYPPVSPESNGKTSSFKKMGGKTWRDRQKSLVPDYDDRAEFSVYITPIILAAKLERHDIISLLIERNEVEIHPLSVTASDVGYDKKAHDKPCPLFESGDCEICHERKVFMGRRKLEESKRLLEVYKAMSSPAYIFETALGAQYHDCVDPVLECFYLSKEMEKMVVEDPSFTKEYFEIRNSCHKLATDILDLCRYNDEVKALMQMSRGVKEVNSLGCTTGMARVLVAINYRQKEFISHPHCQQYIESDWYDGLPTWTYNTEYRRLAFLLYVFLWTIGWPFMCLLFSLKVSPSLIKTMKRPINKFITDTISYLIFLALLFANCWAYSEERNTPVYQFHVIEYIIIAWMVGMAGRQFKMLYRHRFSCQGCHATSGGMEVRPIDNAIVICFGCWAIIKTIGIIWAKVANKQAIPRNEWPNYHPVLISEGFYSLGVVLAFLRLNGIFKASIRLGPLQISLKKMLNDILRFMVIFVIIMTGFVVAITTLYSHYEGSKRVNGTYANYTVEREQGQEFTGFQQTYRTLFWALFGYQEMEHVPDIVVDNMPDPKFNKTGMEDQEVPIVKHKITEGVGYFLVGGYHIVAVIVLLNMLIAMMAKSYDTIEQNSNIEWMFARTRLRMTYYSEVGALPPPFNVLPLGYLVKLCTKSFKNTCHFCMQINEVSFPRSIKDDTEKYKEVIKKLSQRYWNRRREEAEMREFNSISSLGQKRADSLGKMLNELA